MAGEQTPSDALAEIAAMIGDPVATGTPDNGTDQHASGGDDGLTEFQDKPTDVPDVLALKAQLRRTMTERTTAIARERDQIKQKSGEYEQAIRDAEMFRALKESADPHQAIDGIIGKKASPNGITSVDEILQRHKQTFDAPTFAGIKEIAEAIWMQKAQDLVPYQNALNQLLSERQQGEQARAVAEYGDDATKWTEAAQKLQQRTGLSFSDALLVASKGAVALSKIKAKVADVRSRAATSPSVPESSVTTPKKIVLTRDERTSLIRRAAQAAVARGDQNAEQFAKG